MLVRGLICILDALMAKISCNVETAYFFWLVTEFSRVRVVYYCLTPLLILLVDPSSITAGADFLSFVLIASLSRSLL